MELIGISMVMLPPNSGVADRSAPSPRPRPCRLGMCQDLLGEFEIGERSRGAKVVEHDRLAVTRRLGEPDVSGDDRGEDLAAEMLLDFASYLGGETRPSIEHCEHDTFDPQRRIQSFANETDCSQYVSQSLHGVI